MSQALEVTQLLNRHQQHTPDLGEVYAALYQDIKNMASYQLSRLPSGATITPTVLAHEAYEKVYQSIPKNYQDRTHFLRSLGLVMRNFLIDQLRSKKAIKHGERVENYTLSGVTGDDDVAYDMIAFNQALLFISEVDPAYTEILELKLLFGFTFEEIANILSISSRQAMRRWKQAKAILVSVLAEQNDQ